MLHPSIAGRSGDKSRSIDMTHIRTADRAFPLTATVTRATVAILAAILLAIVTTLAVLGPFGAFAPTDRTAAFSPYVIQSAMQWELQRQLQSGDPDPLTEGGREWERQRRQQSPAF
jgi:hypothetical protein